MIRFDSSAFIAAVNQLKRETAIELNTIMNWQMALWVRKIIEKIATDPRLALGAQKNYHDVNVETDINQVFEIPKDSKGGGITYHTWKMPDGDTVVKLPSGAKVFVDAYHWQVSNLDEIHRRARNRKGQVPKGYGSNEHRDGKCYSMKFWPKSIDAARSYVREMRSHVGRTKSSWLKALEYFSSRSGGLAGWTAPSWITRNQSWGDKYGVADSQFNQGSITGYWTSGSNVPWITDRDAQSVINWSGRLRVTDIKSGYALMRLMKIFNKHSAKAV
jgi:hypothetical protein